MTDKSLKEITVITVLVGPDGFIGIKNFSDNVVVQLEDYSWGRPEIWLYNSNSDKPVKRVMTLEEMREREDNLSIKQKQLLSRELGL